jgi:hypothetical protein
MTAAAKFRTVLALSLLFFSGIGATAQSRAGRCNTDENLRAEYREQ